jgi:hypothetical protein
VKRFFARAAGSKGILAEHKGFTNFIDGNVKPEGFFSSAGHE